MNLLQLIEKYLIENELVKRKVVDDYFIEFQTQYFSIAVEVIDFNLRVFTTLIAEDWCLETGKIFSSEEEIKAYVEKVYFAESSLHQLINES